jgi:hypothetical protein
MKKRLLIAAVAATMSVAATADISITGDAYTSFASQKVMSVGGGSNNRDDQRVRVKIVGSAGDTKVVAVIRNDGVTRVDAAKDGSQTSSAHKNGLHMDSLYVTTKAGPVNIKAGDYWDTVGLGARSKGEGQKDAFFASTEVGGWTLGLTAAHATNAANTVAAAATAAATVATANYDAYSTVHDTAKAVSDVVNSDPVVQATNEATTARALVDKTDAEVAKTNVVAVADTVDVTAGSLLNVSATGKIGPVKIGLVHSPDSFTDLTAEATFGGVSIAVEKWDDRTNYQNDTTLVHISGEVGNFKWEIAQIDNDKATITNVEYANKVAETAVVNGRTIIGIDRLFYETTTGEESDVIYTKKDTYGHKLDLRPNFSASDKAVPYLIGGKKVYASKDSIGNYWRTVKEDSDATEERVITHFTSKNVAHATGKLSPLGSMLIGTNARGSTATAVADVGDFTKILGIAVSTKVAGNTVKVIYTESTIGGINDKVTGTELIVSRPLGGATLTANIGKLSGLSSNKYDALSDIRVNDTNVGLRLDVKF